MHLGSLESTQEARVALGYASSNSSLVSCSPNFPRASIRGTQQIVSVNYLFGRPFIPYNFLKEIFTSNFRDMGNLRPSVFGLIKMSFRVPKKGQVRFSERK